ncbi:MAG: hypothetical protein ACYCSN_20830 [Acidobacteriaceae bacterium]
MSGTTYSRTDGHAILPGTWAYVRARGDVPDAEKLPPQDRFDYDTATPEDRSAFMRLAMDHLTRPPEFLRFALANRDDVLPVYPGAVDGSSEGHVANGFLENIDAARCAADLQISVDDLSGHLKNFAGAVQHTQLPVGTRIYRTIGLTTSLVAHGSVTNKLLGAWWESRCPSDYASIEEWRAKTAVLAEWNGDYGYIEVTLARPVFALYGAVGMQKLPRQGSAALPGGGHQFFIPRLRDSDLAEPVSGRPLIDVIRRTEIGARSPA